jgi:BlaI family penicillinase repressor
MAAPISDAEWEIMKALWKKSPLSAQEVIAAVAGKNNWQPETVKTLLGRLVKKQALAFEKTGRTYQYAALVGREECAREEGRSFLARVYDGALAPMIASFIRDARLDDAEIRELKRLLASREGKRGRNG